MHVITSLPILVLVVVTASSPAKSWKLQLLKQFRPALILHMITYHYFFRVRFFPVLEREPCKGVMRKACRVSDAWREKMLLDIIYDGCVYCLSISAPVSLFLVNDICLYNTNVDSCHLIG